MYATLPPDSASTLRRLASIQSRLRRPCSESTGTTVTSRASLPSALLADLEHGLLARQAVEEGVDVVGRVQFARVDGEQVVALDDVDARQGQRRGQRRRPVLTVVDLGELVAIVVDRVVGAEQPGLRRIRRSMRTAHEHVADLNFAEHLDAQVGELVARRQTVEVGLVLGLDLGEIEPVIVRIVEKIALQMPGLAIHLPPLGARIEHGGHGAIVHRLARRPRPANRV